MHKLWVVAMGLILLAGCNSMGGDSIVLSPQRQYLANCSFQSAVWKQNGRIFADASYRCDAERSGAPFGGRTVIQRYTGSNWAPYGGNTIWRNVPSNDSTVGPVVWWHHKAYYPNGCVPGRYRAVVDVWSSKAVSTFVTHFGPEKVISCS